MYSFARFRAQKTPRSFEFFELFSWEAHVEGADIECNHGWYCFLARAKGRVGAGAGGGGGGQLTV